MSIPNANEFNNGTQILGPNNFPLRAIIFECPYDTMLEDDKYQRLFARLMALKINGYQSVYPYGVLPMDSADFVANHIVLAEEIEGEYFPHVAFKSITLTRCKMHFLKFPAYGLLDITDHPTKEPFRNYLDAQINQALQNKEEVGYNGSWTVSKQMRLFKEKLDFRTLSMVLFAGYYQSYGIKHVIAAASQKYKIDVTKIDIGFDYFVHGTAKLDPLNLIPYGHEPFFMMHLKAFSQKMLNLCENPLYKSIWENRLIIQSSKAIRGKSAA